MAKETRGCGAEIKCPACGEKHTELDGYLNVGGWEDLSEDVECDCGATFHLTAHVSITTTAELIEPNLDALGGAA